MFISNSNYQFYQKKKKVIIKFYIWTKDKNKKDKIILCIKPSHTNIYMMLPGWVGFIFPLHRKYGGLVDQSLSTCHWWSLTHW